MMMHLVLRYINDISTIYSISLKQHFVETIYEWNEISQEISDISSTYRQYFGNKQSALFDVINQQILLPACDRSKRIM